MDTGFKLVSPIFTVQINCWVQVVLAVNIFPVTVNIFPVTVTLHIPTLVIKSHLGITVQTRGVR